ncbi:MAG: hypothetical protein IPM38_13660 [Ignavibacteria bacterium]|nr:hypothetical protein [Ignavibacteria bacterium]
MLILTFSAADYAGSVVGDQKVCVSGEFKSNILYSKLFENTNNGGNPKFYAASTS